MDMETLRDLYVEELKDLYSAEKQLVRALTKMAKNASNAELQQAFRNHLAETEGHVERLEEIFESLEASPRGKKCVGMEGLIEEANELLEEDAAEDVVDAGLISKAQHVEHYEMAGYGTVRTWAQTLGEQRHAELLQATLDEEMNADKLLTQLAESTINIEALTGDDEEGEEEASPSRGRGSRGKSASRGSTSRGAGSRGRSGSRGTSARGKSGSRGKRGGSSRSRSR
jgi:ferritin-like metal-binding protein YciE